MMGSLDDLQAAAPTARQSEQKGEKENG